MAVSRLLLVTVLATAGCGYPDFEFTNDAQSAPDLGADSVAVTDSAVDTTIAPQDSSVSETAGDSFAEDSFVADTFVPDTFAPDTFVPDTGVDTAPDTAPTGCSGFTSPPAFCVDFNTSMLPQDGWLTRSLSSASELLLETSGAHSAPKLLVARTAAAATTTVAALVGTTLTAPAIDREARIDVWIKLDPPAFAGKQIYLFKYLRGAGMGDGVAFSLDPTGFFLEVDAPGGGNKRISKPVPIGVWFHVRMDAKLQPATGSATVWIDDMTTPALTYAGSTSDLDSTDRRLSVGVYAVNPTASYAARIDDVSVVWK
jgi:hypothetical protein